MIRALGQYHMTEVLGPLAVVILIYAFRFASYRYMANRRALAAILTPALLVAFPAVAYLSGSATDLRQPVIGRWIFTPIAWLGVLAVSCAVDWFKSDYTLGRWYVRYPAEIAAIPLWTFVWGFACTTVDWVYPELPP